MRNLLLCAALLVVPHLIRAQEVAKTLTAANGEQIGFLQYTPTDYNANPSTKYPLIIFLHGIGERGNGTTDIWRIAGPAIPGYIKNGQTMRFYWNGKWETFLVLSPQLDSKYGSWQDFYVDEMLKYAKANLRIDPNRIILTGLSLGGGGVWHYASSSSAHAQEFAAIAPVCGTCSIQSASNIVNANLPVWAFHAQNDGTVGVGCTTGAINSINSLNPAVKPLMTIYPDGGHGIWDRAFSVDYSWQEPNIYEWFLAQNKSLATNQLPVANAGSNQSITTGLGLVTLNAGGSYDSDGKIVKYIWKQVSGPASTVVKDPLGSSTQITGLLTAGTYQYEVSVVDDRCGISKASVTVSVTAGGSSGNQAPAANAGQDQTITLPTSSVTLNGNGSSDANNDIRTYNWTKVNGPSQYSIANASAASTGVSNLVEGTYTFRLTVTDATGLSDQDDVVITVKSSGRNVEPVSKAGSDITLTLPANSASLDGSASYDPDGSITRYAWLYISGPNGYKIADYTAAKTTISGLVAGTYSFRLVVSDNGGYTNNDTIVIRVNSTSSANQAPTASVDGNVDLTLPTNSTTVNGSGSKDPDGSIVSYQWSKVSGPSTYSIANPNGMSTTISNLAEGTYDFQLKVTDNAGASSVATVAITVKSTSSKPSSDGHTPVSDAGSDIEVVLPATTATLDGSASYDPDGSIVKYAWIWMSGPTMYNIFESPTSVKTNIKNLKKGTYTFRLVVWDDGGYTANDTVVVNVVDVPGQGGSSGGSSTGRNQPPVPKAGSDQQISGSSSRLDGSGSYDPDGSIAKYAWILISGPSQYNIFTTPTASATDIHNLVNGTYYFRLVVWDNDGYTANDTIKVSVGNTSALSLSTNGSTASEITSLATQAGLSLSPNPATDVVQVKYTASATGRVSIRIYDASGSTVLRQEANKAGAAFQVSLPVSNLKSGFYYVEVITPDQQRMVLKLIKQ